MFVLAILPIVHFIGLALCVGAATVKVVLGLKCRSDLSFLPTFFKVSPFMTRQIIIGMILMALSGVAWLFYGYDFSAQLIVKIVIFGIIFIMGPIIDNVAEPKLHRFSPAGGETPSPEFSRALNQFTVLELTATFLFYVIIVYWLFR